MTIDQAKEILSRPFNMTNVPQEVLEAHRMAIEALEQEQVIETFAKSPLVYPITKEWFNEIGSRRRGIKDE